ncbi:MAG TPA: TolC family protein [Polyangiaceae bacterium]|jgi:outer membrane protein TolC|nr:TolC family protein [Polyangiaceae bacterium]
MLRRATLKYSLRGTIAALHVLAVLAPAAAQAADTPTPDVSAPITASPGAQAPGGVGLRIADAVQLALSRNERARISDLNVVVADAAVEKARTGFLPVLTFNGNDTGTAAVAAGQPHLVAQGSVVLNQPLLNASAFPLYAQAKALADAQRAQNVDDKLALAFNATSGFFSVLSASAVVDAAQRQFENAQANSADTQARADAQLTSTNDVTRAKVDLAGASRELESDKGNLANAYIQLSFLLNAPVSGPLVTPDATLSASQANPGSPDNLVKVALDRRPDVLVDKEALVAARHFADEPLLRIIPTIGLQGTASGTSNTPVTTRQWNQESLAGTLTWTLYDAGARYADKHSRDAQASIAELNLQQLARNVDAQVRSAIALLAAAQAEFQGAGQARDAARQNVDETAILYRQGLAKAIELVDANDSRFTAEVNYAGAQYSMAEAYLNLRQAMGLDPLGTEFK